MSGLSRFDHLRSTAEPLQVEYEPDENEPLWSQLSKAALVYLQTPCPFSPLPSEVACSSSAQENQAFPQAVSPAGLPLVPQMAELTCHVSVTIPMSLQPIKKCEMRLNGTTVVQPSKDVAVLSNCCAILTVPQPTPAPVHPSVAVTITQGFSMKQSPACVPQQVPPPT
ncbi:hypothetical protein HPB51_016324 [Rhipicephalus microplus]|uniref:Uncharacterized protein n=1 Tax=Rhipicephalus microplus TaxID=6941 RepID=A0A9J6EPH4_RHIMP|nr:hypothetical protein HPB51_016324 [Rhipicephalus microplus]